MKKLVLGNLLLSLVVTGGCGGGAKYVSPGPPVLVRFVSATPNRPYTLNLRNEDQSLSCEVPCALSIASGTTDVEVRGSAQYQTRMLIPPVATTGTLHERRRSQFIVGTTLGVLFDVAGLSATAAGDIFNRQQDYSKSVVSYGLGVSLLGVSLIGYIIAATAGHNRIVLQPTGPALRRGSESASVRPLPVLTRQTGTNGSTVWSAGISYPAFSSSDASTSAFSRSLAR